MQIKVSPQHCTGCRLCVQVCTIEKFHEVNPKKARLRIEAKFPEPGTYHPTVCTECGICADTCPTEAIIKNENGALHVVEELCTVCGACIDACPENVMMRWKGGIPYKCDFCFMCTEVCNTGSIVKVF